MDDEDELTPDVPAPLADVTLPDGQHLKAAVLRRRRGTLYGRLGGWDVRCHRLEFTPVDTRESLVVPVHRVVGLSGDRYRRGRQQLADLGLDWAG